MRKPQKMCACPMPGGEGMVGCEGDRTVSLYQGPISLFYMLHLWHVIFRKGWMGTGIQNNISLPHKAKVHEINQLPLGVPIKECGQCHAGITWKATSRVWFNGRSHWSRVDCRGDLGSRLSAVLCKPVTVSAVADTISNSIACKKWKRKC